MQSAAYWINHLKLEPHPEGGFYKETYRAHESIPHKGLPPRFSGNRSFSTAIYFLLRSQDKSLFHRIKSDETWHFYDGSPLTLYILREGEVYTYKLGPNPENQESLQITIPANHWFGALVTDTGSFTLSGCTVAPGFDFNDFEFGNREILLKQYPSCQDIIKRLT